MSLCSDSQKQAVNELKKSLKISKDDKVYEQLDEKIILDTNAMQSIATDLVAGSKEVNVNVIGKYFIPSTAGKKFAFWVSNVRQ